METSSTLQTILSHIDPKKTILLVLVLYVANYIRVNIRKSTLAARLHKIAVQKRQQRDAQIALEQIPTNDIPEDIRALILNSTVTELSKLLNQDKITSEQILKVYHSRAITIGFNLHLIGDSNFKEALELARKCDETRKNTKPEDRHTLGGLFGIPMSIKDSFNQKGLDSTCGAAPRCFQPNEKDGAIIATLRSLGVIPFIRSNVPQTLGILDCTNHIWGRGLNPWNKDRTLGGSSGGEAGLIAARCSPIGLGCDGLGSIRIPAAFLGVCGFKPTKGRYVFKGHSKLGIYTDSQFSCIFPGQGPLARCVDDVVLYTREIMKTSAREVDPLHPHVAWNEDVYQSKKKMRIGYVVTEEFFGASKASQRAVRESVEALKKLGHELVEIKFPNFEKMIVLMVQIVSSEGRGRATVITLAGENPIKEIKAQMIFKRFPNFVKQLLKVMLKRKGYTRLAKLLGCLQDITVAQYHDTMSQFYAAREEFLEFFVNQKLDAIVSPAMPVPAFKHGYGVDLLLAATYHFPANIMNLPAGVIPVTLVKEGEDVYTKEECKYDDFLSKMTSKCIEGSVGLPMNVQVMSLPWEDEKCLAVMKMIESEIKFKASPNV